MAEENTMFWFYAFQYAVGVAAVLLTLIILEFSRIKILIKERFLARKGFVKLRFIDLDRRERFFIKKPDANGKVDCRDGAYFINSEQYTYELKGKQPVISGRLPTYTFVANSAIPHEFFTEQEVKRNNSSVQIKQALLAAEGAADVDFIMKLLKNRKLMLILLGILIFIAAAALFSFQTQNTINTFAYCKIPTGLTI